MDVMAIVIATAVVAVIGLIVGLGLGLFGARRRSVKRCRATTAAAADTRAATLWLKPSLPARLR